MEVQDTLTHFCDFHTISQSIRPFGGVPSSHGNLAQNDECFSASQTFITKHFSSACLRSTELSVQRASCCPAPAPRTSSPRLFALRRHQVKQRAALMSDAAHLSSQSNLRSASSCTGAGFAKFHVKRLPRQSCCFLSKKKSCAPWR